MTGHMTLFESFNDVIYLLSTPYVSMYVPIAIAMRSLKSEQFLDAEFSFSMKMEIIPYDES